MKTSHQLARELLELPDRHLAVEMWGGDFYVEAKITDWNSEGDFVDEGEGVVILCCRSAAQDMSQFTIVNHLDPISFVR